MAHAARLALVVTVCAALVLQPVAAYNFNFGGGRRLQLVCVWLPFCVDLERDYYMARLMHSGVPCKNAAKSAARPRDASASAVSGYGSGIYNSARYYQQNGISQGQYRRDLSGALRGSGASASAAASGDFLRHILTPRQHEYRSSTWLLQSN